MKTELVAVNGIEMEYFSFGTGERAFVILPGADTKSVLLAAMAIESAYRCFADDYTVYVFDRRKDMPSPYPVRQMAADTAAVMRSLGIADADVFGASLGGMTALCLAIDAPDLVHKMVIGSSTAAVDDAVTRLMERWIALARSGDRTTLTAALIDCLYSENTIGKYKDFLMHLNDHVTDTDLERFIIQAQAINGFDVYDELDRITCPVLVIGVEGDKTLPPEHSRRMAEKLGCELYMYGEEYGHCVFDEADDYKQRMLEFFAAP